MNAHCAIMTPRPAVQVIPPARYRGQALVGTVQYATAFTTLAGIIVRDVYYRYQVLSGSLDTVQEE